MKGHRQFLVVGCSRGGSALLAVVALLLTLSAHAATYYVTVAGLGGEPDYEQRFTAAAQTLDKLFLAAPGGHVFTLTGKQATRARLTEVLAEIAHQARPEDDLVLTLIGHGSFDGAEYKLNLVGPDLSAPELAGFLDRIPTRRQLVVDTTSASGGAVAALERPNRALIAATKSGTEKNATVFARFWVEALEDPTADVDKSGSISALEAFRYADRKTAAFYESQKRLATEHAVFEDTGHGEPVRAQAAAEANQGREGTLMANLAVVRLGTAQAAMADPAKRDLLTRKDDLEQQIDALKYQKAAMEPGEYKQQLTRLLVQLATLQGELDK